MRMSVYEQDCGVKNERTNERNVYVRVNEHRYWSVKWSFNANFIANASVVTITDAGAAGAIAVVDDDAANRMHAP